MCQIIFAALPFRLLPGMHDQYGTMRHDDYTIAG